MSNEIIRNIANCTEAACQELQKLAAKIVKSVFNSNAKNLIFANNVTPPDIQEDCDKFRELLAEIGVTEIPEKNEDLYLEVVQKLFFFQVERSI